jgi:hypothetical protein
MGRAHPTDSQSCNRKLDLKLGIRPKSMIEKRFFGCPQMLWTTLWETWAGEAQSLDFSGSSCRCPICWQLLRPCKIKDLERIRANTDGGTGAASPCALQHVFWG